MVSSQSQKRSLWRDILANKYVYLLIFPGLLFLFIFNYVPVYGLILAFKEFKFNLGIWGSPWIGFANFEYLFKDPEFWNAFRNTIIISFGKIFLSLPFPILFAILLSELKIIPFKKVVQSLLYFPYFLSWVIVSGLLFNLFSVTDGSIPKLFASMGIDFPVLLGNAKYFRGLVFGSHIWKTTGWGTIVYLAAIVGIDPTLHEAATIDGANRFQRIRYITLPSLSYTIVVLTILNIGGAMNAGFDQIFNLYDPGVYRVGDIVDTYVYRTGLASQTARMEYGVTVGLFKSVINCALLFAANKMANWMGYDGIM